MRRLLWLSGVLALALTLSVGVSTLAARRRSMPRLLSRLHLTDCAPPCWIGIVPGETTIQAARSRIITTFGPHVTINLMSPPALLWATLQVRPDLGNINVTLDAQADDIVDTITFDFHSVYVRDRATLGDFHQVFGPPSRVALPRVILSGDDLGLLYGTDQQGMMIFTPPLDTIRWDQQVTVLVLYGEDLVPIARSTELRLWHGFRPLQKYYTEPLAPK